MATTPARSLSLSMPNTAWVYGWNPMLSRFCASTAAACGLWATSRITVGWPGRIWKRPGSEACSSPRRTACCCTGKRSRTDSSAANAADAFNNWLAPRRAG
ncbi:hypothetical protein D3C78_1494610 [compost metagenome]